MTNSLNQAFIRAYAKDRETAQCRAATNAAESIAAEIQVNADLIQRFDTTTVAIPQPHVASNQSARERIGANVSQTQTVHGQALVTSASDSSADRLRRQIAQEMLRAGDFQNEQIASLNSFFTFPSASNPSTLALMAGNLREPSFGLNDHTEVEVEQAESRAEYFDASSVPLNQKVEPEAPVIDKSEPANLPAFEQLSRPFSKTGSIFRVDTPSSHSDIHAENATDAAPEPTNWMPKIQAAASVKTESELAEPIDTHSHENITQSADTIHAEQVAEAKHVEKQLRNAKVKIFNPVWEVDQLQWPEVCIQLMDARTEALAQVARHLIDACQEGLQVLAITSPQGGEGRTTVACCLARLAGSRGLKTAIVDCDIENPTLSLQTNLEIEKDWQSALINQLPLEEIAVHSIDDQITLVPLMSPIDQDELPVDDQRIGNMLVELSESFDLVIVDMGHMNSSNGLLISLAEQGIVNAAIAVIDHRNSTTQRVESCIRRIRQAGVHSIGLVENFAA